MGESERVKRKNDRKDERNISGLSEKASEKRLSDRNEKEIHGSCKPSLIFCNLYAKSSMFEPRMLCLTHLTPTVHKACLVRTNIPNWIRFSRYYVLLSHFK